MSSYGVALFYIMALHLGLFERRIRTPGKKTVGHLHRRSAHIRCWETRRLRIPNSETRCA